MHDHPDYTWDGLFDAIAHYLNDRMQQAGTDPYSVATGSSNRVTANSATKTSYRNVTYQSIPHRDRSPARTRPDVTCTRCYRKGHTYKECEAQGFKKCGAEGCIANLIPGNTHCPHESIHKLPNQKRQYKQPPPTSSYTPIPVITLPSSREDLIGKERQLPSGKSLKRKHAKKARQERDRLNPEAAQLRQENRKLLKAQSAQIREDKEFDDDWDDLHDDHDNRSVSSERSKRSRSNASRESIDSNNSGYVARRAKHEHR